MFDIGWTELVVIAIVLIIVVGPKDLPPMLRAFGKMATKLRGMAGEFRQQFDEALKEADLDDVRKTIGDAQKLNPVHSIREAMNPLRQMGNEIKADLQKSVSDTPKPQVAASDTPATAAALGLDETKPADTVAAAARASAKKQIEAANGTAADKLAESIEKPKGRRAAKAPATKAAVAKATVAKTSTATPAGAVKPARKAPAAGASTTGRTAPAAKTPAAAKTEKPKTTRTTGAAKKKGDA